MRPPRAQFGPRGKLLACRLYEQRYPTDWTPHLQNLPTTIVATQLTYPPHAIWVIAIDKAVVMPGFRNPVLRISKRGLPKRDESVHSPLPYGYIDQLRRILAAGPDFRDWEWAQGALGCEPGGRGASAPDWFDVNEDQIASLSM